MEPWRVTDETGRVLPIWLNSRQVYAGERGAHTPIAMAAADTSTITIGEFTTAT
jgi:hypothetical protein